MKFLKFLLALCLLPTVFFALVETSRLFIQVMSQWRLMLLFVGGGCAYALIHFGCYNFSRWYVLGHEVTHAIAALLCGSRVHDMSVREESGYVKMDKSNAWIVLAPYVVPGYVILSFLCYLVLDLFMDVAPYRPIFIFMVGFFTAFHWIQTIKTLTEADQPDLKLAGGKIFSYIIIGLVNLVVLAVVLKGLFPQTISLLAAGERIVVGSLNVWRILVNYIVEKILNAA